MVLYQRSGCFISVIASFCSILERLGLSSSEAHRRLTTELTELTAINRNSRRWIVDVFLPPYRFINVLLTHVGAVSLLVSYADNSEWHVLVEGVVLLLLGIVNFYLLIRENYNAHNGILRKLKETIQALISNTPSSHYPSEPIATARGQLTVSVLRDHVTVNLPASLLVHGDVVLLAVNQACPANVTKVNDRSVRLLKGHAITEADLNGGSNAFFEISDTPLLSQLQLALSHQQDTSILESERNHVYKIIHVYLFWSLLMLLVILAIVKQASLNNDTGGWIELILQLPAYSLLPLLLPSLPLYWWLGNCFTLAKLSVLFDAQKPTTGQVLIKMIKMMFNFTSNLNYSFLHFLGTVSTFCAVDKEYLLASSHPLPEKVFFFRGTEVAADSCGSSPPQDPTEVPCSKDDSTTNLLADGDRRSSDSSAGDFVLIEAEILQISPSQDSRSGIFFDNSEWHRYLTSLNPIALCSRVTSHMGRVPHIDVHLSEHLRHTQCSCRLSIEVGVADLDFKPTSTVFVVDNKRRTRSTSSMFQLTHSDNIPVHMISMVVQGKKCPQLMSAGSAHMILTCCSDLWDGQDLIPMTNLECKKVMEFFNRRSVASYCIGLAYNPLLEQLEPLESVYVIKEPDQHVPKQLQGQVFLGMLSLQYQPAPDMVELVEQLDIAGVRFVHFAAENELQIRGFTEKLGLEVGWNCHISLSPDAGHNESHDEKGDNENPSIASSNSSISLAVNDFEAYNRAKLPKGIKLIRSHIVDVDNVPLLVPLFTDCMAASISEMMLIMQENDEVVVCIGSSWNTDNIEIFSQANVSIAVEPDSNGNPVCDDQPTQLQAASQLNSCPCDLVIPRSSNTSILLLMILHSRHLLSCLRQSLLFGLGGSLLLTTLLISSDVMFLPPALSGSHVFWFSFFVLPVISSSLLGSSPNEEELKNKMMDKCNKLWIKQWRYTIYFMCSFLSTAIMCLLLFAITLGKICSEISDRDSDCHSLLGDRNETSQWNGWRDRYSGGLLLAQNVTAFFLCCYLIILSFHFSLQIIPLRQFYRSLQLPWLIVIVMVLSLQVVYFTVSLSTAGSPDSQIKLSLVPVWVWPFGASWAVILVVIQESIKLREKKLMSHTQKHLRLEFGTKLGMNSPF